MSLPSAFQALGMGDMTSVGQQGLDLLMNPRHTRWLAPFLLLVDAVLCALIIRTVDYTEIDWVAYMQQVKQYIDGERDYTLIKGSTGPLVYPAMHVYIYRGLYEITQQGTNIVLAQVYFAFLYVFNLGLVMACYRRAQAPPYVFPMLILSKRLHSIYVLRCFNDGFAMSFLFLAIYLFQRKEWTFGAIAFSFGVGVKMTLLLALPTVAILIYQANGPWKSVEILSYILQVQLLSGIPFMRRNTFGYLGRAFEFTRQFKYQWTVNWKFVSEATFLSRGFSYGLLAAHISILGLFTFTRWFRPLGRSPRELIRLALANPSAEAQKRIVRQMSSDFILTAILTSIAIGMLCARSLHFQFFSWIAWATPFLLWKSKMNPLLQVFLWFGQEVAWNQYPSNELSSKIVVGVLAVTVVWVWLGTDEERPKTVLAALQAVEKQEKKER